MPKPNAVTISKSVPEQPQVDEVKVPIAFHFLTEGALHFRYARLKTESPRDVVPPQTPNSEYAFDDGFKLLPSPFPDLDNLEVPFVREKGVRSCIEILGNYFGCKDYKFNLLQFWFLDVITDCFWRAQDDFRLPVELQKTIVSWILYFIDLIRDKQRNISRKKFFSIFKEAILVAAEIVDEGCDSVPLPEKVFSLIEKDEDVKSISSSDCSSSCSSIELESADYDNVSCVEVTVDGIERLYELPKEVCTCDQYDLSSVDTVTETETHTEQSENKEVYEEEEKSEQFENINFYQADSNIPARFLPLPEEEEVEQETVPEKSIPSKSICVMEDLHETLADEETGIEDVYYVYEVPDKYCVKMISPASSETIQGSETTDALQEEAVVEHTNIEKYRHKSLTKHEILKGLAYQKLWEQRLLDMEHPRKGWIPTEADKTELENEEEIVEEIESLADEAEDDDEWVDIILKKHKKKISEIEDQQIINFGVLWAITDFIFKYFYESFQFQLIKLAFHATPNLITQKVNAEWKIPKKLKRELQKPKEEKPKKVKAPKPKKEKKEKPKKEKKEKKEKPKKQPKPKKEKPVPLTKEQKAELERQKKEQERLAEELRKVEEHKRFMYPLTDAATDDLFHGIFENWVKVDLTKGKGKGKGKGKKK